MKKVYESPRCETVEMEVGSNMLQDSPASLEVTDENRYDPNKVGETNTNNIWETW